MLVLGIGFIALVIVRAKIEEDKLDETSALYRGHRQKTGFLFPRRQPRATTLDSSSE